VGALSALAMSAFAANSLLCRAALGGGRIDAASFTTLRLVSGALALAVLARGARGHGHVHGTWASAAALFGYALAFSLAYLRIPAAVGALLLFGAVQATMVGWALLSGERPRPLEWLGLVTAFAGLVALTRPGLLAPDPLGCALMIAAGACWGVYSLRGRSAGDPLLANASHFARTVPLALLASLVAWIFVEPRLSYHGALLAVASGALASGLGYAVWFAALRGLTATQAAIVQLAAPPLAAVGAVAFLGERLTLRLAVAGVAILGGVGLAVSSRREGSPLAGLSATDPGGTASSGPPPSRTRRHR
jgi:drug/metabolite transporter (DMT)-like permease